jgi:hypothetical protein
VLPLFRLLDAAAAAEPLLMWLAWAITATALAALPSMAGRVPSLLASLLLIVPGGALFGLAFTLFSMLLSDTVRLHPFLNVAIALAVNAAALLAGWRHGGSLPRHLQSTEVTLKLARPALVTIVLLAVLTLHPFTTVAAIPLVLGAAVGVTEVILTRLTLAGLKRSSNGPSSADLRRFGCVAPVHVVPDGSMAFLAVAVGLTHGASAVFLQQRVEDALHSTDPALVGRATHILAHEAGHVVQHHGLWRTMAASLAAATLPLFVRSNDLRSMAVAAASLVVLGLATYTLGEWSAERFARRVTRIVGPDRVSLETNP